MKQSRTPPSEAFSGDEEYSSYRRKSKGTLHKGLGNKAMNEALNQVAGLRVPAFHALD